MKNSRLFQILYLLVERRAMTAKELAQRFEVSERTIYRDVDALSAAGIPIYAQQGQGGGIRLMEQFVLDRALLSTQQQDELLFALQAILATGAVDSGDTLSRLSALFRREGSDWLEVDFLDWGSGAAERENFQLIKQAVLSRRILSFHYDSSAGTHTTRRTEPVKLVFKSGNWYLLAFCLKRQDWRLFRLVRMEQLEVEEACFLPRPVPAQEQGEIPIAYHTVQMCLAFQPDVSYRVRDFFNPGQITRGEDGRLLVECAFPEDNWVQSFLLSFGNQVEVQSPDYWRDILLQEAKKMVALYERRQTMSGLGGYDESIEEGTTPPHYKEVISMEDRKFCQCCGMPLDAPKDMGTQADGSANEEYCCYCFQKGAFTAPEATMDDMIAFNLKFNQENGFPFGPQEQAETNMRAWFPTLKRWTKG